MITGFLRGFLAAAVLTTPVFAGSPFDSIGQLLSSDASPAAIETRCGEFIAAIEARQAQIITEAGAPDVATTLVAYDELSALLTYSFMEAELYRQVLAGDAQSEAASACQVRLTGKESAINLSRPIYDRLSAIDVAGEDASTQYLLARTLAAFDRAGVGLDEEKRARVQVLTEEIATVSAKFDENIDQAVGSISVRPEELAGLPEDYIAARQPGENGDIELTTAYPDYYPVMSYADNDDVRRRFDEVFGRRAYPENDDVLRKLITLRQELAATLGRPNFATLILENRMVNSPAKVEKLLKDMQKMARKPGRNDYRRLLAALRETQPDAKMVEQWQVAYLKTKVAAADYDYDSAEVRRYFAYDNVRDGMLQLTRDLFGVEIRPWETAVWHEDVAAYEMLEGGAVIGRFYFDAHPREGKFSHDNALPLRPGVPGVEPPVAALVMNLPKGGYDTGLMSHSDVMVFLHEYGHLLHALFGGGQRWLSQSGIATEFDFAEAPSMMLENWVYDYDTLAAFARDESGAVIPRDLVEKMRNARHFNRARFDLFLMGAANMSLKFHEQAPPENLGASARAWKDEYDLVASPEWLEYQASFGHLASYSATVYTYLWSIVIAADFFTRFEAEGLRNRETADAYRRLVLQPGGSKPAMELVRDFLERDLQFNGYRSSLSEGE